MKKICPKRTLVQNSLEIYNFAQILNKSCTIILFSTKIHWRIQNSLIRKFLFTSCCISCFRWLILNFSTLFFFYYSHCHWLIINFYSYKLDRFVLWLKMGWNFWMGKVRFIIAANTGDEIFFFCIVIIFVINNYIIHYFFLSFLAGSIRPFG